MNTINCFYKGTKTIDYAITVEQVSDGVLVTCSQFDLEKEFFPSVTVQEFIEDYGDEYVSEFYEIL